MKKFFYLCGLLLLLNTECLQAQNEPLNVAKADAEVNKSKTGNSADVLAKYFQIAANNLTSNDKNITLKINWFALNGMDPVHKFENANYLRTRWQRNGQFILAGGIDKDGKANSFQAGLNFNVLNLRDSTEFNYFEYYDKALLAIDRIKSAETDSFHSQVAASIKARLDNIVTDQYRKRIANQFKAEIYSQIKTFPTDAAIDELIKTAQENLNTGISKLDTLGFSKLTGNISNYAAISMLDKVLNAYTTSFGKQAISFDVYVDASLIQKIISAIDRDIQNNPLLQKAYKATSLTDVDKKIYKQYRELVDYVAHQPIITFGYNYTYRKGDIRSSHVFGFEGLWGLNKIGSKKTNELSASLTDTITNTVSAGQPNPITRNIGALQAGINTVLIMDSKVSLMELNVAVEDDLLFSKALNNENKNKFTFNSTFRVRLPNSPWLKFTIKYDVKKANVLGFLNFTYNLDK